MASSYAEAAALLPAGAVWSSSFGNPGEGGYTEYHRTSGGRWRISNGPHDAVGPLVWETAFVSFTYGVHVDRRGQYWCGLVVEAASPIQACEAGRAWRLGARCPRSASTPRVAWLASASSRGLRHAERN